MKLRSFKNFVKNLYNIKLAKQIIYIIVFCAVAIIIGTFLPLIISVIFTPEVVSALSRIAQECIVFSGVVSTNVAELIASLYMKLNTAPHVIPFLILAGLGIIILILLSIFEYLLKLFVNYNLLGDSSLWRKNLIAYILCYVVLVASAAYVVKPLYDKFGNPYELLKKLLLNAVPTTAADVPATLASAPGLPGLSSTDPAAAAALATTLAPVTAPPSALPKATGLGALGDGLKTTTALVGDGLKTTLGSVTAPPAALPKATGLGALGDGLKTAKTALGDGLNTTTANAALGNAAAEGLKGLFSNNKKK